tara:strand:+ start:345 stop:623 length:279 start_codon:yes stop_codon:yes gene_type:complete
MKGKFMTNKIEKIRLYNKDMGNNLLFEYYIKLGDKFIIEHGANQHGKGKALFELKKITKHGGLYGLKTSLNQKKIFNKNHKLNIDTLIEIAK